MEAVALSAELTSISPRVQSDALLPARAPAVVAAKAEGRSGASIIHFSLLLAIIALGAALRFMYLDRPAIWGDEAATFGRVSGTFDELMDRLQGAGFAPLHYELYWWIGQHALLTPFMMRLVPAVAGTLMIPAMYWLAAQLVGRQAALIAALLTATNAFLLNYSRDAKMYSHFWFFTVLNVATLLWWLRVRTPLSWIAWIATGTAMVGLDALGWIVIAVELVMVLTTARPNWLSLLRLVLLLACAAFVWCLTFGIWVLATRFVAHLVDDIVGGYSSFRGYTLHPEAITLAVCLMALIPVLCIAIGIGLNPPRLVRAISVWRSDGGRPPSWVVRVSGWFPERLLVSPWIASRTAAFRWPPLALFLFGLLIMFAGPFGYYYDFNRFLERVDDRGWDGTGIQWVQGYNAGRDGASLVGYAGSAFLTSWEWPRAVDVPLILPRTLRLLTVGTLAIVGVLALGLLPLPWSRQLRPPRGIGGWRSAFWLILWLTLPPYAFYCVSIKDHVGAEAWLQTAQATLHEYRWVGPCIIILGLLWFAFAGNTWRQRLVRSLQFFAVAGVTLLIVQGLYLLYPKIDTALSAHSQGWREHGSVWMPRYLGIVLPALLIIAAALLWRLPTRPLRWFAVSILVIVNLSVHAARVFAGNEPPSALLARDIVDSQIDQPSSPRAYFDNSLQWGGAGEPGTVALRSPVIRYYITILSPRPKQVGSEALPPNEVLESQMRYRLLPGRMTWLSFTSFIINDVRRSPNMRSFITWERLEPGEIDLTDKPLDALEPDWRLASEQTFAVRDHWRWKDLCTLRRRVYVRAAPGVP